MKVIIDADGCPVTKIAVKISKENKIPVLIVKNYAHKIVSDYAEVVTVDIGSDSADYYIVNRTEKEDIVITQDYGLAAMVLSKGGSCITQHGMIINSFNIDSLLDRRHVNRHIRMTQGKYSKNKKRTDKDDSKFISSFKALLTHQK